MARNSVNSLSSSLRGKIWVSTVVLAFFVCTFGLISYLVVSLLVNDAFYGIFLPFLFLAFAIMLFGWWLSNEVVNPIEKVTLLAKSLERSNSTSIPKSSGSAETDQLLQTIQRNNQQIQKIITQMDKVAHGNLDIAPMDGSDRLSTAFQKLLAKVSESINAKEELDEISRAVNELKKSVVGVTSGNLDVYISSDFEQTRELSAAFRYLIENLSRLITSVQENSTSADSAVKRVGQEIGDLIERDGARVQELAEASDALKQVPDLINKITEDLMGSAKSAKQSIEKARYGNEVANQNSNAVSNLRKQIREDVKRIQNLTEKAHDIERVAKTVEDLANRTNMIALNASIQATEMGEDGHGFVLVADEVERLATRANGTNKQISTLNKTILAEIGKVENSVETTMMEVASLSKHAIETGNVLSELERYVAQFLNLQESLIAYSKDQSEETDAAFGTFAESISDTEESVEKLTASSRDLESLSRIIKDLNVAAGKFRLPEELPSFNPAPHDREEPELFAEQSDEETSHDPEGLDGGPPAESGQHASNVESEAEVSPDEFDSGTDLSQANGAEDGAEGAEDYALESFHANPSESQATDGFSPETPASADLSSDSEFEPEEFEGDTKAYDELGSASEFEPGEFQGDAGEYQEPSSANEFEPGDFQSDTEGLDEPGSANELDPGELQHGAVVAKEWNSDGEFEPEEFEVETHAPGEFGSGDEIEPGEFQDDAEDEWSTGNEFKPENFEGDAPVAEDWNADGEFEPEEFHGHASDSVESNSGTDFGPGEDYEPAADASPDSLSAVDTETGDDKDFDFPDFARDNFRPADADVPGDAAAADEQSEASFDGAQSEECETYEDSPINQPAPSEFESWGDATVEPAGADLAEDEPEMESYSVRLANLLESKEPEDPVDLNFNDDLAGNDESNLPV